MIAQMDEDTEHLWKDLCIVCLSACLRIRGVTRCILDPLVLELQAALSHSGWVLGAELRPSVKAGSTFNC